MSDTGKRTLSPVSDDSAPRIRECVECEQPIPAERERSSFCSNACRDRRQKRRRREYLELSLTIDETTLDLRAEHGPIGSIWGVLCAREVAEVLREEARRPRRPRRRIPFPKSDIESATLEL